MVGPLMVGPGPLPSLHPPALPLGGGPSPHYLPMVGPPMFGPGQPGVVGPGSGVQDWIRRSRLQSQSGLQ